MPDAEQNWLNVEAETVRIASKVDGSSSAETMMEKEEGLRLLASFENRVPAKIGYQFLVVST